MSDFDICMGCGDVPTNDLSDESSNTPYYEETAEEIQAKIDKGLIMDSTGRWYDPTDYLGSYYADW